MEFSETEFPVMRVLGNSRVRKTLQREFDSDLFLLN